MKNLGDKIAMFATPIARMLKMDCIDPQTRQLRPESGCAKRKAMLNQGKYVDAFYDFFWTTNNKTEEKHAMNYTVTKQIAVEADSPEEAVSKASEGKTITITVAPRVQQIAKHATIVPPQQQ